MTDRFFYRTQAGYTTLVVLASLLAYKADATKGHGIFATLALACMVQRGLFALVPKWTTIIKLLVAAFGVVLCGAALLMHVYPNQNIPEGSVSGLALFGLGFLILPPLIAEACKEDELLTKAKRLEGQRIIFYAVQPAAAVFALLAHVAEAQAWFPIAILCLTAFFQALYADTVDRMRCGPAEVVAGPGARSTAS